MIRLYNISKYFGAGRAALANLSLHIEKGEFVLVSGPSGAGKTTLINLLFGEQPPSSGKAIVGGRNVHRMTRPDLALLRREVGLVPQHPRLIERIAAIDNVALAAEVSGATSMEARRKAEGLLEAVGMEECQDVPPRYMSSGERQRVSLARALANDPSLLLADEPTGHLDIDTVFAICGLLKDVNEAGTTVVMTSHDETMSELLRCRTIQIDAGRLVTRDEEVSACL